MVLSDLIPSRNQPSRTTIYSRPISRSNVYRGTRPVYDRPLRRSKKHWYQNQQLKEHLAGWIAVVILILLAGLSGAVMNGDFYGL